MPHDIDSNHIENDEEGENMVSNLPLLFAAGYPTSLEKISETQLEKFIPFMVQCSLGEIQLPIVDCCREPEWWPEDLPFAIPMKRPALYSGDWFNKLKELVAICYQFHKSVFLLRFCENLSMYQPESLRFINNYNSTTSLFDRISNKLLVTFRNENMLYDQAPTNHKKTLMPRTTSSHSVEPQQMVEQSLFDIYLCDNCEAELYSLEAYQEHEKTCQVDPLQSEEDADDDDDDVIFCGEEEPVDKIQQQQNSFLQNFQLCSKNIPIDQQSSKLFSPQKRNAASGSNNNNNSFNNKNCAKTEDKSVPDRKPATKPRRTHAAMILSKCPAIPITSPAGQRLISNSNAPLTETYRHERIERYERFCPAPILGYDGTNRPRFMDKRFSTYNISSFRSTSKHYHFYKFPRRQWSTKSRNEATARFEQILLKETKCKPLRVAVDRLSHKDILALQMQTREKRQKLMAAVPGIAKAKVIDFIDLCSESEKSDNEDDDDDGKMSMNSYETPSSSIADPNIQMKNSVLFIDCSTVDQPISNGHFSIARPTNSTLQPRPVCDSTSNSLCDSTNLLDSKAIQKLFVTHSPLGGIFRTERMQTDENHLYPYTGEQSDSPSDTYIYENDTHNELNIHTSIGPSSIPANNFMSIDLTL